jgi:erythronate-4-phosphate dehydrogenase
LQRLKPEQLLLNTSRGPVIDNVALARRLRANGPASVLDVWENEPAIDPALFRSCRLGTPHVAGYSREGKLRGTARLYQAFCEWQGLSGDPASVVPPEADIRQSVGNPQDLLALLRSRYDVRNDHGALRAALDAPDPAAAFDGLRKNYPVRHECAGLRVRGRVTEAWRPLLSALGVTQAS